MNDITIETAINAHTSLAETLENSNAYHEIAECYESLQGLYCQLITMKNHLPINHSSKNLNAHYSALIEQCEFTMEKLQQSIETGCNDYLESQESL